MLTTLPVVRSAAARALFLCSAMVTAAILLWAHHLGLKGELHGLAPIFFVLFAGFDYQAAACMLVILTCAVFISNRLPARAMLRWISAKAVGVAIFSAVILCAGSLLVYRNHPLAMDEYAQLFQSQIFAAGHLAGQFPTALVDRLVLPGFQNSFLSVSHDTGAVASGYWPSFALLLTPFTLLGISWACNPVISALTLLAAHRLALRVYANEEAAGLVILLILASPVFFASGISYYSMPAHLLASTLFALLLVEATNRSAFLAGVAGSIALTLHNPVPHLLFAIPWIVWLATRPGGWRLLGRLLAGYAPLCLLLGIGWFWFTDALRAADVAAAAVASSATSASSTSTLVRMWETLSVFSIPNSTVLLARVIGVAKIWVWAVPGLLILAGVGAWKWRHNAVCRLLTASALVTLLGYVIVPVDQGHGWGYRYFHSAWIALPLLAAGALTQVPGMQARAPLCEDPDLRTFVLACAVLSLLLGVSFRAVQMHGFISEDLAQVPGYDGTERRVVLIDVGSSFYGVDLIQNDPWLRGNVIRMLSYGRAADEAFMRKQFSTLHPVFADRYGSVWSTAVPGVSHGPRLPLSPASK